MTADTTTLPVAAPCEHCGSTDIFIEREDLSAYQARCNDCGSRGPIVEEGRYYDDEEAGQRDAIAAWNRRAATAPAPAVPSGFRLVPIEPTDAMMNAGEAAYGNEYIAYEGAIPHDVVCHSVMRAMIAAAPPAPSASPAASTEAPEGEPKYRIRITPDMSYDQINAAAAAEEARVEALKGGTEALTETAIDRAVRALMLHKFGDDAAVMFDIPSDAPEHARAAVSNRLAEARREVLAVAEALAAARAASPADGVVADILPEEPTKAHLSAIWTALGWRKCATADEEARGVYRALRRAALRGRGEG